MTSYYYIFSNTNLLAGFKLISSWRGSLSESVGGNVINIKFYINVAAHALVAPLPRPSWLIYVRFANIGKSQAKRT